MKTSILKIAFLSLLFISIFQAIHAQTASIEKSVFGLQTGFLGIWVHNEARLTNKIALRTEIGLDADIFTGYNYPKTGYFLVPAITLEPRWYYNINKRVRKSINIAGNSGNFISLKITYHPDVIVISNYDNIDFINDFSIIPTWGIRRQIGHHFNYETGIGIGYIHYFNSNNVSF
jgi:hypothetical protein